MKKKTKNTILYILTAIPALAVFYFMWLLYGPVDLIQIKNDPLPLTKNVLQRGEPVPFVLDYCRPSDLIYTVTPQFTNGVILTAESFVSVLDVGCHKVVSNTVKVPMELIPGRYHLHFIVEYKLNSFRTETLRFATEEFEVK